MSNTSNRYDLSGNVTTNAVEYTGSGRAVASSVFDGGLEGSELVDIVLEFTHFLSDEVRFTPTNKG